MNVCLDQSKVQKTEDIHPPKTGDVRSLSGLLTLIAMRIGSDVMNARSAIKLRLVIHLAGGWGRAVDDPL